MKLSKWASATTFAHLMGLRAKRAQEEDEEEKEAEDDEEHAEDESDEEKKSQKAKRAQADDEEKEAEDDEEADEDESDEEKKSQKARRAQAQAEARGRRLERARAQTIFASAAAGAHPDVAAHLVFETDMPSRQAIALLTSIASGAPKSNALAERMVSVRVPNVGVSDAIATDSPDSRALAASILAAGRKARGEA